MAETDKDVTFIRTVKPALGMSIEIKYHNHRLSLTGSYCGCYGQIYGELRNLIEAEPKRLRFSPETSRKLCDIWDRWHLNDMRAGTPKQEEAVREYRKVSHRGYKYEEICDHLKEIGLYEDAGYRYGSGWLFEEVPQDVLRWLFSLLGEGSTADDVAPAEIDDSAFASILRA